VVVAQYGKTIERPTRSMHHYQTVAPPDELFQSALRALSPTRAVVIEHHHGVSRQRFAGHAGRLFVDPHVEAASIEQ